ncbi:hypothetical protein F8388_007862 [Cannabis sativa]|uniref:Uncharacterized protein n=1 Tax=Cannabis sativa TaxID=3483 RepID=A0A7J6EMJ3_CANSA|nr:hypothetical protein G4B88_000459 [Cannabis sativa]KAF4373956.1 hypothetical protein F8388_007862 [Cannabis sativa]
MGGSETSKELMQLEHKNPSTSPLGLDLQTPDAVAAAETGLWVEREDESHLQAALRAAAFHSTTLFVGEDFGVL